MPRPLVHQHHDLRRCPVKSHSSQEGNVRDLYEFASYSGKGSHVVNVQRARGGVPAAAITPRANDNRPRIACRLLANRSR